MRSAFIAIVILLGIGCHDSNSVRKENGSPRIDSLPESLTSAKRKMFEYPYKYNDFKIDTFSSKKALIDFNSNKQANKYKSAIVWSYNKFGLEFGGYYGLARWGDGPNTLHGVIIDFRDGKIYDLPDGSLDYGYQKDSRLLIVNPPDSLGFYDDCFYCKPEVWIWNESAKKFEKQVKY